MVEESEPKMEKKERHFVLVHGACHGAWCWYKVATQLKSMGHKVSAIDMAASGIHPQQVHEIHSMSDYFEPLMEFMASLQPEERVILVGHSKGGFCISAAMERFQDKVSVAVFAAAMMPGPELTFLTLSQQFNDRLDADTQLEFHNGNRTDEAATSVLFGPDLMASKLYQLSPPEDLTLALSLARPVAVYRDEESIKATAVTMEKYGSVPRVYIVCDKDNLIKPDFQRWIIEHSPPDEAKLISDSDHMPMFSKPNELCVSLQEIADKYT